MVTDSTRAVAPPTTAAALLRLRHVVLPVFYAVGLSALVVAVIVHGAHPQVTAALIAGTVTTLSGAVLVLEIAGARLFAQVIPGEEGRYLAEQSERLVRGYSWGRRASLLAQAISCWFVTGIATVCASQLAGEALRDRSPALSGAARSLASWPEGVRVLVAFLALDAWSYARHRLEHANGERNILWRRVHRWHHTPTDISIWTGMTVHPIEAVLVFAVPITTFGALGYARWEAMLLFALFVVITMPQHMNSGWTTGPLGAIFHGPEAHTHHHSVRRDERNTNFADCLTLWDRLFGTYEKPTSEVFRGPFGPSDDAPPRA